MRISTVQELCELDPNALDFALSDQVEHLTDLISDAEKDAKDFFSKNFVTQGMKKLLREGLLRLNGKSNQAVFELRQAMGGGKTHSMLALGLLAKHPELYDQVPRDITAGLDGKACSVVAVHGRSVSQEHFIWGEIADQLGKKEQFGQFWKNGATAPTENDWVKIIGDAPTLILLDELPPYFDYARTRQVGGGTLATVTTYALSNLLSAAMKLPRTAIVMSNLVGTYKEATKELSKVISNLSEETKRQALPITPVDLNSNEIYDILRKRMFKRLPEIDEVEKIASKFGEALSLAERSNAIMKSEEQIADEVLGSYPFHPSVKHIIALFKENENYRQTRGLMQFVSKMLKSVWTGEQTNDIYLIGCQHLDLKLPDVREEITRIGNLEGALARDVASVGNDAHAQVIDASKGNNAASQIAKILLTASLSDSVDSIKGLTETKIFEYLVTPDRSPSEFQDAFTALQQECWYLHRKNNDVWYFSNTENLKKRIQNRAETAPSGKIDEEMQRRLSIVFEPKTKRAYQEVRALPRIDDVALNASDRFLLVLSPDSKNPPDAAKAFLDGQLYKNGFCVVAGDGSSMGSLEEKTRRIWAVAKVKAEMGNNPSYAAELQEEEETAEFEFSSTVTALFNRVYYPSPITTDKTKAELKHAPLKMVVERAGKTSTIALNGEAFVEAALVSTGAQKLVEDVEENAEKLMTRAEDFLWPESQTRIPWKDFTSRAQTNFRWSWLPPKGLEKLRDHAVSIGRWSYDPKDGYIDKAPKPPKTSVDIVTEASDDKTGEARLAFHPMNAGHKPEISISLTGNFEEDGKLLEENPFTTDATKLWVKVVDPEGKHEEGEVVVWSNKLSLKHDPQQIGDKRVVTLQVKPRGIIRWNTDGSNVKEGKPYEGPIELAGSDQVTIYAYAEDQGVSVEQSFTISANASEKYIDRNKPVRVSKNFKAETIESSFRFLDLVKSNDVTISSASLTIGSGSNNVMLRFGDEVPLTADAAKALIQAARTAVGNLNAEVKITAKTLLFSTGFGMDQFAKEWAEDIAPSEVDQA